MQTFRVPASVAPLIAPAIPITVADLLP
jgi:hypothetical protein